MSKNGKKNSKKLEKPLTNEEYLDRTFHFLEPYLKMGFSIRKACLKAGIPKTLVYEDYKRDHGFADRIDAAKAYYSILVGDIIYKHIQSIRKKQKAKQPLTEEDIKFVQWVATNSNSLREEFDRNDFTADIEHQELELKQKKYISEQLKNEELTNTETNFLK